MKFRGISVGRVSVKNTCSTKIKETQSLNMARVPFILRVKWEGEDRWTYSPGDDLLCFDEILEWRSEHWRWLWFLGKKRTSRLFLEVHFSNFGGLIEVINQNLIRTWNRKIWSDTVSLYSKLLLPRYKQARILQVYMIICRIVSYSILRSELVKCPKPYQD